MILEISSLDSSFADFNSAFNSPLFLEHVSIKLFKICSVKRGEIKAEIQSAKELSNDEINKIAEDLAKNFSSKMKLNYKYDKSLIGGLVIKVGSTMIDTSIKNKLQQIENRMIEA